MSTRITNSLADSVASAMIRHAFTERVDILGRRGRIFANDVYNDIFDAPTRRKMAALPEGWMPTAGQISVKFGDHGAGVAVLNLDGHHPWAKRFGGGLPLASQAPPPPAWRVPWSTNKSILKVYDLDHPLAHRWEEFCAQRADLQKAIEDAERSIKATLHSFTTVNAVLKQWPEAEPFLRRYVETKPDQLPDIPRARLNSILDLPIDGAVALVGEEVS